MTEIQITVKNKIATCLARNPNIICGNSDYEVHFTFDEEWDAHYEKTARFIYGGKFTDVKFSGTVCSVPIIVGATQCKIGVYAGNLRTTTPAVIDCQTSILDISASESEGGVETTPNSFAVYVENVKEYAEQAEKSSIRYTRYIADDAQITPSSVSPVPSTLVLGDDYKGTFTVDGMTMYLNDSNIDNNTGDNLENLFFAIRKDLNEPVGFQINLDSEREIASIQLYLWGTYYEVVLRVYTSTDGASWNHSDITIPSILEGALSVYRISINKTAKYVRVLQTQGWTNHRFIVKGVELFSATYDGQYVIARNNGVKDYLDTFDANVLLDEVNTTLDAHNTDPEAHTDMRAILNNSSNALKGAASGEAVRVDDVSPVEHKTRVNVKGKNLIPFPYSYEAGDYSGVTFTVAENGGVVLNGTATKNAAFRFLTQGNIKVKGKFTLSGCDSGTSTTYYIQPFVNGTAQSAVYNAPKTYDWDGILTDVALFFKEGAVFENVQILPMLEEGDTATEYEPYIDPSSVTVTRCGKNLFNTNDYSVSVGNLITNEADGQKYTVGGDAGTDTLAYSAGAITFRFPENIKINDSVAISLYVTLLEQGAYDNRLRVWGMSDVGANEYATVMLTTGKRQKISCTYSSGVGALTGIMFYLNNNKLLLEADTLQVELDEVTTDFEAYKGETYTPNADGTVEISSLAPTMTLVTDTAGAIIDLEYNKDINAENEAVRADITELDNTVAEHTVLLGDVETALDNIIAIQTGLIGG